ncbi:MAG: DUF1726 domain-containing protein, partial [Nanoarchaeota archaeon]|nr:DUF1726 domain-containing protein [Nanoarchaeota archaeon]
MDILNDYNKLLCKIIRNNHRGIVVLSGKDYFDILSNLLKIYYEKIKNFKDKIKILYISEDFNGDYLYRFQKLEEKIDFLDIEKIKYKDSKKILGKTYDILILDMYKSLTPDYIGRIIETLSGIGIA